MKERIIEGYHPFILPFAIALAFVLVILAIGLVKIFISLPARDKKKLFKLLRPDIFFRTIKDIIFDSLLHIKIFKRNKVLGYMHSSIAFGWFMLILVGHIEVLIYTPQRTGILYYPVFFRFFVMETQETLRGAFFFFLMDFFLLIVLSGIVLAIIKRFHSRILGMRRTTRLSLADTVALYSLWLIFPLRLVAESFTANISGGSFLTTSINHLLKAFVSKPENVMPIWWAYSISLGIFFLALPFTRYMHIPTEIILIALRNAGIKSSKSRGGYADAEIFSCSSCGICIDACPMSAKKRNLKNTTVYFIRFLRRFNGKEIISADKCLMCGKCVELCPVGIDSCRLKRLRREENLKYSGIQDYSYLPSFKDKNEKHFDVLYYGGCMTSLTPIISKSLCSILKKANVSYEYLDKNDSICCGRPLLLAGKSSDAKELINRNSDLIKQFNAKILLVSCPICFKVFNEDYQLKGIKIMHHTQFLDLLIKNSALKLNFSGKSYTYHDPCELGRGSNVYKAPRRVLSFIGDLSSLSKEKNESVCCGGSLGSLSLSAAERKAITESSLEILYENRPEEIITACPLCMKTFSQYSKLPVKDISQIVLENIKN